MPAERTTMRQVREIVRLHQAGVSTREIGIRVGVAASTVRLTLRRVAVAGMVDAIPAEQTDAALEKLLFTGSGKKTGHRRCADPDWASIHQELKRKHVALTIVWDEYIAREPDGYRYSRFCELYRCWEVRLSVTMRQSHRAGEKLFVDYAGDTVPVVLERLTGERRGAQIFVAVLGASSFLYAEATWTQALVDWIEAHNRALAAIGGVPALLVPDNTKVAVIKACLYDPVINRTYADMAAHYGTAVLPARPYKPRDKAKVEVGVLIAALAARPTATHDIPQPGRVELGHRRVLPPPKRRPGHPTCGPDPAAPTRDDRPSCPQGATGRTLRSSGMADPTCRHRLPRRGREPLLQRAAPLCPGRSRCPVYRSNGRGIPARGTHRHPPARQRRRQAHHPAGPHAVQPSALC